MALLRNFVMARAPSILLYLLYSDQTAQHHIYGEPEKQNKRKEKASPIILRQKASPIILRQLFKDTIHVAHISSTHAQNLYAWPYPAAEEGAKYRNCSLNLCRHVHI